MAVSDDNLLIGHAVLKRIPRDEPWAWCHVGTGLVSVGAVTAPRALRLTTSIGLSPVFRVSRLAALPALRRCPHSKARGQRAGLPGCSLGRRKEQGGWQKLTLPLGACAWMWHILRWFISHLLGCITRPSEHPRNGKRQCSFLQGIASPVENVRT